MSTRQYSPEQTAEALARVATGESSNSVSKSMGIPRSTIRLWLKVTQPTAMATPAQSINFAEQVMGLAGDYVQNLRTILHETQSPAWIKGQTAADLARFADSIFGQLAALGAAIERGQDLADVNEQARGRFASSAGAPDEPWPLEANASPPTT